MANWEKKSSYLLREIVKFRTYIDSLQAAEAAKQKIYKERGDRKKEIDGIEEETKESDVEAGENVEEQEEEEADDTLRPE